MVRVRVIKVVFDTELKDFEIPAFRGAIIDTVGREHVVFHNHIGDDKFHYKYPVIQYKTHGRKASIVCIKDGVDEIHHFFSNNKGTIRIGRSERPLLVDSVKINQFEIEVRESYSYYSIKNWLPLNEINIKKFASLEGIVERSEFLERMLIGNILSMAKGLDWTVDKPIEVKLQNIRSQKMVGFKGQKLMTFEVDFKTNVFLPYDIGLGKSASMGYGTLSKQN